MPVNTSFYCDLSQQKHYISIQPALTFAELSPAVKDKVLEAHRYFHVDDCVMWYESIYEKWYAKLQKEGFHQVKIAFGGFGTQGDGASFTARVDIAAYLQQHRLTRNYRSVLKAIEGISCEIKRDSYCHAYTVNVAIEYLGIDEKVEQQIDTLQKHLETQVRRYSSIIYKELEEEFYYLISDEILIQTFTDEEYFFTPEGKRLDS